MNLEASSPDDVAQSILGQLGHDENDQLGQEVAQKKTAQILKMEADMLEFTNDETFILDVSRKASMMKPEVSVTMQLSFLDLSHHISQPFEEASQGGKRLSYAQMFSTIKTCVFDVFSEKGGRFGVKVMDYLAVQNLDYTVLDVTAGIFSDAKKAENISQ